MTSQPRSEGDYLKGGAGGSEVPLTIGTRACVWNHFLRRWTDGFAVAEVVSDGYRLRRLSDGHVFSHVFSRGDVMEERRKVQELDYGIQIDRRVSHLWE